MHWVIAIAAVSIGLAGWMLWIAFLLVTGQESLQEENRWVVWALTPFLIFISYAMILFPFRGIRYFSLNSKALTFKNFLTGKMTEQPLENIEKISHLHTLNGALAKHIFFNDGSRIHIGLFGVSNTDKLISFLEQKIPGKFE